MCSEAAEAMPEVDCIYTYLLEGASTPVKTPLAPQMFEPPRP